MKTKSQGIREKLFGRLLDVEEKYAHLLVSSGADPWVVYRDGWYHYCRVLDDWQIAVNKVERLEDIGNGSIVVWRHPLGNPGAEVWAPELHYVQGKWYIYCTMGKAAQHRMYVLEATTADPLGDYEFRGEMAESSRRWAIDGTLLQLKSELFLIWSGWGATDVRQNLYIAPMSNPWTISGERVLIASPELSWEKASRDGLCDVNEGPEVLEHNGKIFIIYSASHSLTDDYCLGMLTLAGNDPLKHESWQKLPRPVFCKTDAAFGPGHASFKKTPDGSDWMVYHTAKYSGAGWDRQVMAQKFTWYEDGTPNFGSPLPLKQKPSWAHKRRSRKTLSRLKIP